jgi:hypothetical protein
MNNAEQRSNREERESALFSLCAAVSGPKMKSTLEIKMTFGAEIGHEEAKEKK